MIKCPAIFLSFDDYYLKGWVDILPLMARYDVKATFYISNLNRFSDAHWAAIMTLHEAGHCIGCHGYKHLRAGEVGRAADDPTRKDKEIYLDFHTYLADEIDRFLEQMTERGIDCRHFAYPYGNRSAESDAHLLTRFRTLRVGGGRIYLPNELRTERIFGSYDFGKREDEEWSGHEDKPTAALNHKGAAFLYQHRPVVKRLEWLFQFGMQKGIRFLSMKEFD